MVPATIGASVLHASAWPAWDPWDPWFALQAAIAGGLLGNLVWVCLGVRRRVTRTGATLAGLCLAAWACFLLFGAPHKALPVQEMGVDLWHGQPVMVAGRSVGVHGSVNAADRFLGVLAFEAIGFTIVVVGLATGTISDHAVTQSYVVAGIAVVLSTAWWLAFGNAVSAFRRRRRERRVVVPATTS